MAKIEINHLVKNFAEFVAVEDSSFTIEDGEFFMLLGPSGCGKTTTLRMIAGLEQPSSGEIFFDGENVTHKTASQRDIAFVFQMFGLYPHLNVFNNIAYPLKSQGFSRASIREKVEKAANIIGITSFLHHPVGGLSSGDRQRVALARAIVREPKAFLMDEPLGALDAEFREHMSGELRTLHDEMNATTVYVTHDQLEAMQMGDKIVIMNQGKIEQWGTPAEVYQNPATLFVADFIGSPPMNLLPFRQNVANGTDHIILADNKINIPVIEEQQSFENLSLGIRPEHIKLHDSNGLRGKIIASEYLGNYQIITLETQFGEVKARAGLDIHVSMGDQTGLIFQPEKISLFDVNSGRSIKMAR